MARLVHGHPWIFGNEIESGLSRVAPGELVRILDPAGIPFAVGYANPNTLIAVRILGAPGIELDAGWMRDRVRAAWELRERVLPDPRYGRLIYGESDGLPGIIVDRFDSVLVVQALTVGAERLTPLLVDLLREIFDPVCIVAANDSSFRGMEGLPRERTILYGELPLPVVCREAGLEFEIDSLGGQKTGFYYDQRDNRRRFAELVPGGRVLDLFCYTGAWALVAAKAGATAIGRDSSEPALALARANAERNGLGAHCTFESAELLEAAPIPPEEIEAFDSVIVDPPPLARNRKSRPSAWRALARLCRDATARVRPGGLLVVCVCTHHLSADDLRDAVAVGGAKAGRTLRVIGTGTQAADHPILPSAPETAYLHALFVDVR
jgi:23S rRNA (cytosine1962-C5)-methyltransferase